MKILDKKSKINLTKKEKIRKIKDDSIKVQVTRQKYLDLRGQRNENENKVSFYRKYKRLL